MSAIAVQHYTAKKAAARRAKILKSVGDESDFRQRAALYLLSSDEQELFDELEDLDYLLSL